MNKPVDTPVDRLREIFEPLWAEHGKSLFADELLRDNAKKLMFSGFLLGYTTRYKEEGAGALTP